MATDLSPKVAVIIVNWNAGDYLMQCMAALSQQTYPHYRAIVVDNASSDDSIQAIAQHYPAVEIIQLNENTGFATANNIGIRAAEAAEWIALLNPDAFPEPDWLEKLIGGTQQFPSYDFFASRMLVAAQPDLLDGAGDDYHVSGLVWRRGCGFAAAGRYQEAEEVFAPCAAAALYRRCILLEVGGFDEDFFCYIEDVDLGFRLRLAGYRCGYLPQAVVRHVGSAITGKQSDFSVYHGHRNLVWTYLKNMPSGWFWFYLPQHLLLNLLSLAWFCGRAKARVIARAKWDALRGITKMWRKRKQIQAQRRINMAGLRLLLQRGLPVKR